MKNCLIAAWITVIITGVLAFSFMAHGAEVSVIFSVLHRFAAGLALALTVVAGLRLAVLSISLNKADNAVAVK